LFYITTFVRLDFSTNLKEITSYGAFYSKNSHSDTNSTFSVTFIKSIGITLFNFLEKGIYGK